MSRDFLQAEFPWFLNTYDNFRFPIQKEHTVRYFILRHYGGIYIDLDYVRLPSPQLQPHLQPASCMQAS